MARRFHALVEDRLAAFGHKIAPIGFTYQLENEIQDDTEVGVALRTRVVPPSQPLPAPDVEATAYQLHPQAASLARSRTDAVLCGAIPR